MSTPERKLCPWLLARNHHPEQCPYCTNVLVLTERTRRDLRNDMERVRQAAWQLELDLDVDEIDSLKAIQNINGMVTTLKRIDRTIKARRRAATKKASTTT